LLRLGDLYWFWLCFNWLSRFGSFDRLGGFWLSFNRFHWFCLYLIGLDHISLCLNKLDWHRLCLHRFDRYRLCLHRFRNLFLNHLLCRHLLIALLGHLCLFDLLHKQTQLI